MGQIQYTQLKDKECCQGSSNKVYDIPVGATVHEIATITGVSIGKAIELQASLLVDSIDCDVFLSAEIEETLVKNNCTQGIGSAVIVTSPEGQFSSQISQEDANLKARTYFDARKQDIANAQGNCIETITNFSNTAISEDLQKNNCTQGEGSTETITLSAGIYTSTLSQVDADTKAQEAFDKTKQIKANQIGSCVEAGCEGCTSYRVSSTVECGEYRYNTQCMDGVCTDVSSEYFVCTGNCSGETCIPECTSCGPNCLTGTCSEGYLCINGNCEPNCNGEFCSFQCPDNPTNDACTECIGGKAEPINCGSGKTCENGTCCTLASGTNEMTPCCEGLFILNDTCLTACPNGYTASNGICVPQSICNRLLEIPITEAPAGQTLRYTYVVNLDVNFVKLTYYKFVGSSNNIQIYVNGVSKIITGCIEDRTFYIPVKQNDIIDVDVTVNCNNGQALGSYGRLEFGCTTYNVEAGTPEGTTYSATSVATETSQKYWYITEDKVLNFAFDAYSGRNRALFSVLEGDQLIISPNDAGFVSGSLPVNKGDILRIDVQTHRSPTPITDSVASNGELYNGWIMVITEG